MLDTYVVLNILVATLKKWKETGEINFNNIFFQYIQNTILPYCWYKN